MITVAKPMLRVNHLALIIDGNRRYAKYMNIKPSEGHMKGFHKLLEIIEFCSLLGIKMVTIYGFSLQNFSRTRIEISELLNMIVEMSGEGSHLEEFTKRVKCRVRFCGDFSFLGKDIRKILNKISEDTSEFNKITLNICASYGARNEIADALKKTSSTSPREFYKHLSAGDCDPPNILIRTSGESRLSDFLIYQCSEFTSFYFVRELWPELTFNRLVYILIHYSVFEPTHNFINSFTKFHRDLAIK
ncbi:dehydrodolichyl diphosphate synthase [Theileria orientalis]|uniref:Alkyl transferase n=1 Tax=Theileria orientalis TaxID=68886 RepID=A0A976M5Q0_THEOR|nr:dehydrodolichyl diphosphate synthase [Theileria orientalis]